MSRRNFTQLQKEQIVERAKINGVVYCDGCGLALKKGDWEVDHIIAEGLRPEADKQRPITIAEGQLLGKECCHRGEDGKTNKDVKAIAKGKRQYNGHNGIRTRPVQKFPQRPPIVSERTAARNKDKLPIPERKRPFYAAKEETQP